MRIDEERLRTELYRRGLSQIWLSEVTGLSRATISSVMNGKSCREETLNKITNALGIRSGKEEDERTSGKYKKGNCIRDRFEKCK